MHQCEKMAFTSPRAAHQAVKSVHQNYSEILHIYKCGSCRQFHIGHSERNVGKTKREKLFEIKVRESEGSKYVLHRN